MSSILPWIRSLGHFSPAFLALQSFAASKSQYFAARDRLTLRLGAAGCGASLKACTLSSVHCLHAHRCPAFTFPSYSRDILCTSISRQTLLAAGRLYVRFFPLLSSPRCKLFRLKHAPHAAAQSPDLIHLVFPGLSRMRRVKKRCSMPTTPIARYPTHSVSPAATAVHLDPRRLDPSCAGRLRLRIPGAPDEDAGPAPLAPYPCPSRFHPHATMTGFNPLRQLVHSRHVRVNRRWQEES
ncbi:hypothetical protein B0H19DRAFT_1085848 [Mycena capillaripes]|nr:hypothetical protein B0H19DRAFT_1085848 [Mycena capillaripes]